MFGFRTRKREERIVEKREEGLDVGLLIDILNGYRTAYYLDEETRSRCIRVMEDLLDEARNG